MRTHSPLFSRADTTSRCILQADQEASRSPVAPQTRKSVRLAGLVAHRATGFENARKPPPLPGRCQEGRSERPDSTQNYDAASFSLTASAGLPYTAREAGHTRMLEEPERLANADFGVSATADSRGIGSGRGGDCAESSAPPTPFDQGCLGLCTCHQHGCCGRFFSVLVPAAVSRPADTPTTAPPR